MYLRLHKFVVAPAGSSASHNTWGQTQVADWLATNKLEAHTELVVKNGLTSAALLDMEHADLQSMGVERCHDRKTILRWEYFFPKLNRAVPCIFLPRRRPSPTSDGKPISVLDSVYFQDLPRP